MKPVVKLALALVIVSANAAFSEPTSADEERWFGCLTRDSGAFDAACTCQDPDHTFYISDKGALCAALSGNGDPDNPGFSCGGGDADCTVVPYVPGL